MVRKDSLVVNLSHVKHFSAYLLKSLLYLGIFSFFMWSVAVLLECFVLCFVLKCKLLCLFPAWEEELYYQKGKVFWGV